MFHDSSFAFLASDACDLSKDEHAARSIQSPWSVKSNIKNSLTEVAQQIPHAYWIIHLFCLKLILYTIYQWLYDYMLLVLVCQRHLVQAISGPRSNMSNPHKTVHVDPVSFLRLNNTQSREVYGTICVCLQLKPTKITMWPLKRSNLIGSIVTKLRLEGLNHAIAA